LTSVHAKTVSKCLAHGCNFGYNKKHEKVHGFSFRFNKPDLSTKWIKSDNRSDWKPTKISIVCIQHFKADVIKKL